MGMVQVDIEVGHRDGGEMVRIPDVLVDTGRRTHDVASVYARGTPHRPD